MCGINGIITLGDQEIKRSNIQRMNDLLEHRGPDGEGIFLDQFVGLGHRRLSIIDIEGGKQPFIDEHLVLSFNGEIYNYLEIRKELEGSHQFKTNSDTEVIVKAFKEWGIGCIQKFRGMFAFAIYDQRKKEVFIVRDRAGIKPLFYTQQGQKLYFCSELSPLLHIDAIPRAINTAVIEDYFKYLYIPTPYTIYQNIFKLPPAHYLKIDLNTKQIAQKRYWSLPLKAQKLSEQAWLEQLDFTLKDIIKIYTRSDVKFGAFLSGGVDSSLVTAQMADFLPQTVKTFTIGFEEHQHSELPYALDAANIIGTEHFAETVRPTFEAGFIENILKHFGEPFADSSFIPTFFVSQLTSQHVKMVLTGDGGDELFAGYNSYPAVFTQLEQLKKSRSYRYLYPFYALTKPLLNQRIGGPVQQTHDSQRIVFSALERSNLLHSSLIKEEGTAPTFFSKDFITHCQVQDFTTYLNDDILTKVDRMSMAHSLETRVPLLDHALIELAFTMPSHLKILRNSQNDIITKYILKKQASSYFTAKFLNRPKQGFGIPITEWIFEPLKGIITQTIYNESNPAYEYLKYKEVKKMVDDFYEKKPVSSAKVWAIFIFTLWFDKLSRI